MDSHESEEILGSDASGTGPAPSWNLPPGLPPISHTGESRENNNNKSLVVLGLRGEGREGGWERNHSETSPEVYPTAGEGNYPTAEHSSLPASTNVSGRRQKRIVKFTAKAHRSTKTLTFSNKITECFSYFAHVTITSTVNCIISNVIRQKKTKCIQIENEEINLSFFWHMS